MMEKRDRIEGMEEQEIQYRKKNETEMEKRLFG